MLFDDIPERIQKIYRSSTPDEQKILMQILKELSDSDRGYSSTYTDIWLADYKEIPVDIDTFLCDDMYLGKTNRNGAAVYPFWKKELHTVFDAGNKFWEWILTGATRIGKTSTFNTGMAYMLYRLMCLRDPQAFFGKKEISTFSVLFFNLTEDLARGVAFREFNDTLMASPWYCLRGNTEVLTPHGYSCIQDLVDTQEPVYTLSSKGLELITPEAIKVTGYATELIEIELADGTIISGTPEHKIMLSDKTFKCLKDLTEEDDLMEVHQEIFMSVPGFEDRYEISTQGRLRCIHSIQNQYGVNVFRRYNVHKHSYDTVDAANHGVQIAECVPELMMRTFYPDLPSDRFYLEGDIHDNSLSNIHPGRRYLGDDWKDVPGTDGVVQVSTNGELYCHTHWRHRNLRRQIVREHYIKFQVDNDGYKYVSENILTDLGYHFVHRIVASVFIPNPNDMPVVNHIDGVKTNNNIQNLEWVSVAENGLHARTLGLCTFIHRKVTEINSGEVFRSMQAAANKFGISCSSVLKSVRLDTPVCNNLRFSYYED